MDYTYILDKLEYTLHTGTILDPQGNYNPAWNVACMMKDIAKLIRTIEDEINQEQESK